MNLYIVPGTRMKQDLEGEEYIVASDEGEAVGLAVGAYMATNKPQRVWVGENGLLNAMDALVTLVKLYEMPIELTVYLRHDEPQHSMVAEHAEELCKLYGIQATFK